MGNKLPILVLVLISIATLLISFKYSNIINYDKGFEFGLNEGEKHFKNTLNVLLKNNEEVFLNHYEFSKNVVEFVEEITYIPDEFRINQIIDSINYNILKTFLNFSKVPNNKQIKVFGQYHEIKNDLIKDYYSHLETLNFFEDLDEKYFERKSKVLLKPITEVSLDRLWSILSEDIQSNLVNNLLKTSSSDEIEEELVLYSKEEFCLILSQNIVEVLNSSLLDYAKIYSFSGNIEKSSNRREKVSKLVSLEKKINFYF